MTQKRSEAIGSDLNSSNIEMVQVMSDDLGISQVEFVNRVLTSWADDHRDELGNSRERARAANGRVPSFSRTFFLDGNVGARILTVGWANQDRFYCEQYSVGASAQTAYNTDEHLSLIEFAPTSDFGIDDVRAILRGRDVFLEDVIDAVDRAGIHYERREEDGGYLKKELDIQDASSQDGLS